MKKTILTIAAAATALLTTTAFSYDINDAIGDKLGSKEFELYGINVSRSESQKNLLNFNVYTNYPESGKSVSSRDFTWNTFPADLAIDADQDGNYEYGVAFTTHDNVEKGNLYRVASWNTSNSYDPSNGTRFLYNKNQIVTIQNGTLMQKASVNWNQIGSNPSYNIDIPLKAKAGGNINLFYGGATCANDYVGGSVRVNPAPEPISSALLLLGSGALILRQYRKKLKKEKK